MGGDEMPMPGFFMPPGWIPQNNNSDAAGELAKQMVKLTEIIVQLTTQPGEVVQMPVRARSPDAEPVVTVEPRAGPSPGDRDPPEPAPAAEPAAPAATVVPTSDNPPPERLATEAIAPPLPRRRPRAPEPLLAPVPEPAPDPAAQYRDEVMHRLLDLDRQRRRLRAWMDDEEADSLPAWPRPGDLERADDQPGGDTA